MHMHQSLARIGNAQHRIALRGYLAKPASKQNGKIGGADPGRELRVRTNAQVTGIARVRGVKQMRAAKGGGNRQAKTLRKLPHGSAGGLGPAAAAKQQNRPRSPLQTLV